LKRFTDTLHPLQSIRIRETKKRGKEKKIEKIYGYSRPPPEHLYSRKGEKKSCINLKIKKRQRKERRRQKQRKKAARLYDDFISRKAISMEPEQQERQKYSSEKYSTGELSQRRSIWQKAVS